MSTETMQNRHHAAEDKLGALGRRIDGVRDRARDGKERLDNRIERRLDAVRAKDAEIRTELRRMAEEDDAAWDAYFQELDREMDELDAEVAVMESQLAAEAAEDWDAYERAAQEELEAYDRLLESSRQKMAHKKEDVRRRSSEAADRARDKVRRAGDALRHGRDAAALRWAETRDEIRREMDEVDEAVIEAVLNVEGQTADGSSDGER